MSENERILVTSKEAAKLLNISERTLWTITNAGQIPYVKILGAKRYHRSDIEQFIRDNTMRNTPTDIEQNNHQ